MNLLKLNKLLPLALLVLFLTVTSCKDEKFSDWVRIHPSVMMPLAHGQLTLGNLLLSEGSGFSPDSDNTIRLVLRTDSILSVSLNETLDLPLPDTISRSFSTRPVRLENFTTTSRISLNEIAGRIDEAEGTFIRESAGKKVLFPEIPSQDIGGFHAEKIEMLEYAEFSSGRVELTVRNNFPVRVSMQIRLVNETSRTEVARMEFRDIEPGASATRRSSLEKKAVKSIGHHRDNILQDCGKLFESSY